MVKKRFVFLLQQIICRIMLFVFYVGGVCLVFGVWCLVFGVWCLVTQSLTHLDIDLDHYKFGFFVVCIHMSSLCLQSIRPYIPQVY